MIFRFIQRVKSKMYTYSNNPSISNYTTRKRRFKETDFHTIFQDKAGMGRAYGNIGNAYSAAGFYEQAIKYHKQELTISKEVHDRSSEASTHGNLAVAYQALGAHDMALFHYRAHLGKA